MIMILKDEYGNLNSELEFKDSLIEEYSQEIKRLLKEGQLNEAKIKIAKLREISVKYVKQVFFIITKQSTFT